MHVCLYAGRAVEAYSNVCLCFCVHRGEIISVVYGGFIWKDACGKQVHITMYGRVKSATPTSGCNFGPPSNIQPRIN